MFGSLGPMTPQMMAMLQAQQGGGMPQGMQPGMPQGMPQGQPMPNAAPQMPQMAAAMGNGAAGMIPHTPISPPPQAQDMSQMMGPGSPLSMMLMQMGRGQAGVSPQTLAQGMPNMPGLAGAGAQGIPTPPPQSMELPWWMQMGNGPAPT